MKTAILNSILGVTIEYKSFSRGKFGKEDEVVKFNKDVHAQIDVIHETEDRLEQVLFLIEFANNRKLEPYYSSVVRPYIDRKSVEISVSRIMGSMLSLSEEEYDKVIRDMWTSVMPFHRTSMQKKIVGLYLIRKPDGLKGTITAKEKAELYG